MWLNLYDPEDFTGTAEFFEIWPGDEVLGDGRGDLELGECGGGLTLVEEAEEVDFFLEASSLASKLSLEKKK